ncbi:hypothetical protein TRVL_07662 [Trypanosoma vivax]|nr:hypothetical protein TRVL_07662 [Trypanosoma vivax]
MTGRHAGAHESNERGAESATASKRPRRPNQHSNENLAATRSWCAGKLLSNRISQLTFPPFTVVLHNRAETWQIGPSLEHCWLAEITSNENRETNNKTGIAPVFVVISKQGCRCNSHSFTVRYRFFRNQTFTSTDVNILHLFACSLSCWQAREWIFRSRMRVLIII